MAHEGERSPHLSNGPSPLSYLIQRALTRSGEFSASTVSGDVALLMLDFANEVIDLVNQHPYRDHKPAVAYYQSLEDIRPELADNYMVLGMAYKYLFEQGSQRAQTVGRNFQTTLNTQLWHELNGNTPIQMRVVDGGSNPRYTNGKVVNPTNGQLEDPDN